MIFCPHTSLKMCSNAGSGSDKSSINSASRLGLPASHYLLHPCSRARSSSSYVQDVLYADFAGAKIGENKISIRAMLSLVVGVTFLPFTFHASPFTE